MPIGTARMAAACLPRSTLVVGTEIEDRREVRAVLDDPARPAILLWPGPGARDLALEPPSGPVTLVVVDGTWALAKKLVRINPRIASLPRYALSPDQPSRYQIRSEPRVECVSTLEAIMYALGILEGDSDKFQPMLAPFLAMVQTQLEHEERMHGSRLRRRLRRVKPRPVPLSLREPGALVVIAGEANAWPRSAQAPDRRPPHPDELVQWLAIRVADGARFEAIVAPRNPLSPATSAHTRLADEVVLGGIAWGEFAARWRSFVRDDDVICGWGHYAATLLQRQGGHLPGAYVDLRSAAMRWLRAKPGSAEMFCERIGAAPAPLGQGRGGQRLANALAVTRHLMAGSAAPS